MLTILKDLWRYRNFVVSSIRAELLARFASSRLGGLWLILEPLSQVAIYALILSNVLSARLPSVDSTYAYAIYLVSGLLAWTLFFEVIMRCLTLFIEQATLMKKLNFPRITLPAIVLGSCLLNNAMLLAATLLIFLLLGHSLAPVMLWVLPLTVSVVGLAIGLGMIFGILNVFLRDVGKVVPIILQIVFWLTPIVYPVAIIPEEYRELFNYNPLYHLVSAYHDVLVYQRSPALDGLLWVLLFAAAAVFLAMILFRRASAEMVDVL
jgi:lipopolysaccharide transport system permease protein